MASSPASLVCDHKYKSRRPAGTSKGNSTNSNTGANIDTVCLGKTHRCSPSISTLSKILALPKVASSIRRCVTPLRPDWHHSDQFEPSYLDYSLSDVSVCETNREQ